MPEGKVTRAKARNAPAKTYPNSVLLAAVEGFAALIKIGFPVELSLQYQQSLQALRFATKPVEDERDRLVLACAKRKKGAVVYGDQPNQVVIEPAKVAHYTAELDRLMRLERAVDVTPVKRSEIPRKVNGRDVIMPGDIFEQLGPFLVN